MMMYKISQDKRKWSPTPIVRVEVVNGKEKESIVLIAPLMDGEGTFFDRHKATEAWLQEIVNHLNKKS
jgi:hypothetical protein